MLNAPESLHTHTTLSDGKNTHQEMFEAGEKLGLSVMAFTDHDSLPTNSQLEYLNSMRDAKMKWIIGIEITAAPSKDTTFQEGSLHVVGLFVNPKDKSLLDHCRQAHKDRVKRLKTTVAHLRVLGFEITEEACLAVSQGAIISRPHIVQALISKPQNFSIIESLRKEMEREAKTNPKIRKKYDEMIERGEGGYPYYLFLSRNAYRPKIFAEDSYTPSLDDVVGMIHGAGGIASLPHYFTERDRISLDALRKLLADKRIDGAETVYRTKPYQPIELPDIKKEREEVKKIAIETNALTTGGPDAHCIEDIRSFLEARGLANETIGMTEKILASGKVDKRWSSF